MEPLCPVLHRCCTTSCVTDTVLCAVSWGLWCAQASCSADTLPLRAAVLFRWLANRLPDRSMRETRAARARLIALVQRLISQRKAELSRQHGGRGAGDPRSKTRDDMLST